LTIYAIDLGKVCQTAKPANRQHTDIISFLMLARHLLYILPSEGFYNPLISVDTVLTLVGPDSQRNGSQPLASLPRTSPRPRGLFCFYQSKLNIRVLAGNNIGLKIDARH
jgi:hypothetical protein